MTLASPPSLITVSEAAQLHCAHGYLLREFLSPLSNRRDDEYGGRLENRMRFPLEVFDAVRAAFPANRAVSMRVSGTDWADRGWDISTKQSPSHRPLRRAVAPPSTYRAAVLLRPSGSRSGRAIRCH